MMRGRAGGPSAVGSALLAAAVAGTVAACSSGPTAGAAAGTVGPGAVVAAVGAENQYANVISQIGGRYVRVTAIMSNPNTDPHTFEASAAVAREVSAARLVVQNGLGYDTFMNRIEAAAPNPARKVIDVQKLLGFPNDTRNPHLWYQPGTMTAVANAVATDLAALDPAHTGYFRANERRFVTSLSGWYQAIAAFRKKYAGTPVATTEPVADYLLQAAGADNLTPWSLQADIMNGVDPSPQDVAFEQHLLAAHKVRVLVYNQQVTDPVTRSFLALAKRSGVPVVGVYETMPTPGYDYQSWMMAETHALQQAVAHGISTGEL